MAERITIRLDGIQKDLTDIKTGLKGVNKELDKTDQKAEEAGSSFLSMGNIIKTGLVAGLAFATKAAVDLAAGMETTRTQYKTLLGGDAEGANNLITQLSEFANQTAFTTNEVLGAGRSLLAFGVEANNLEGSLQAVGDIAAGTGTNFGELAEIFGKAKVQGRLFGEDINQLSGRGIPIIAELAKNFGVAESEIKKMVSEGKVGFPELEKAFQTMTGEGGKFNGMMEELSKTFQGRLSTALGKLETLGAKAGGALLPFLADGLEMGIQFFDFLNKQGEHLHKIFAPIQPIFDAIGNAISTVAAQFEGAANSGTFLLDVFNAIGKAFQFFAPVFEVIGRIITTQFNRISDLFAKVNDLIGGGDGFLKMAKIAGSVVVGVFTGVLTVIEKTLMAMGSLTKAMFSLFEGDFGAAKTQFSKGLEGLMGGAIIDGVTAGLDAGFGAFDSKLTDVLSGGEKEAGTTGTTSGAAGGLSAPTTSAATQTQTQTTASSKVTGQSQKIINIDFESIIGKQEINTTTVNSKDSVDDMVKQVAEGITQILNEANRVALT